MNSSIKLSVIFLSILWVLPLAAQSSFTVSNASTTPGASVSLQISLTNESDIQGFQTALTWDNAILTLTEANFTGMDIETALAPYTIEFFTTTSDPALTPTMGWGATAGIFDFSPPFESQVLPPGTDQTVVYYRFSTNSNPILIGTSPPLSLQNGLGSPPLFNVITVAGSSVLPDLVDGAVTFIDAPLFKRGDSNADGFINLADAIRMIQYLFNDGAVPTCLDGADANGDGLADVSDAIFLIQFQFLDGPAPGSPYPDCGPDPSADSLSCESYSAC